MAASSEVLTHLAKRFFGSVVARPLSAEQATWVASQLLPGEQALWNRQSTADQRHCYDVAQRVIELLGDDATRAVVAAALLHDIGKIDAGLGTFGRVAATVVGGVVPAERRTSWRDTDGVRGRFYRYLDHNDLGATLLTEAGSDALTIAWAREHELDRKTWTLPPEISAALYDADNI
jgi:hypothetical protein